MWFERDGMHEVGKSLPAPKAPPEPEGASRLKRFSDVIQNPETPLEELRRLIKEFNNRGAVLRYTQGKTPILVPLSHVQRIALGHEDHLSVPISYDILEQAGLPVNTVTHKAKTATGEVVTRRYYITFARCQDAAVEMLKEKAPKAHIKTLVLQIYGPESARVPNANTLSGTQRYTHRAVGNVLRELGINSSHAKGVRDRLQSSPVSVFKYMGRLYINASDADALKSHFQR